MICILLMITDQKPLWCKMWISQSWQRLLIVGCFSIECIIGLVEELAPLNGLLAPVDPLTRRSDRLPLCPLRGTGTSPRRPPRWPIRSPRPAWRSCPRPTTSTSTSTSPASEPAGPAPGPAPHQRPAQRPGYPGRRRPHSTSPQRREGAEPRPPRCVAPSRRRSAFTLIAFLIPTPDPKISCQTTFS